MRDAARAHVDLPHGRVAYLRAGSGPPVVLIHGTLTTADDMALALFAALAERFDVVAFDRPGHGDSDQLAGGGSSARAQGAALSDAWRSLGLHRPVVLGHSLGGAVALALGIDQPDAVAGVVALAPICFPEVRFEHVVFAPWAPPILGEAYARTFGLAADVALLPVLRNAMFLPQAMPAGYSQTFPFAWASHPDAMVANARDGFAELPTLAWSALNYPSCRSVVAILGGTHDLVVSNARHGLVAAGLMPSGSFRWVTGAGHMLHHFEQSLVADAIAGVQAAAAPA